MSWLHQKDWCIGSGGVATNNTVLLEELPQKPLCIAVLSTDYRFNCDIFWVRWHRFWEFKLKSEFRTRSIQLNIFLVYNIFFWWAVYSVTSILCCWTGLLTVDMSHVRNTTSTYVLISVTVCLGSALSQHVFNVHYRDSTAMVRSPLAMSPQSTPTSFVEDTPDTPAPTRMMSSDGSNTKVTFPVPQSEWKFCTPTRPRTKSLRTPEYSNGQIVFKDFHTKSMTKNAMSPGASGATSYSLSPLSLKFSSTYVAAVHKRRAAYVRELMGSNSSSCTGTIAVNTDKGNVRTTMNSWEVQS